MSSRNKKFWTKSEKKKRRVLKEAAEGSRLLLQPSPMALRTGCGKMSEGEFGMRQNIEGQQNEE